MCDKMMCEKCVGVTMADYDFYMSNKQIKADAKDVLSGSWNVACKGTFVVATILIVPIVATILLSIFVAWWLAIPLGIVCLLLCQKIRKNLLEIL